MPAQRTLIVSGIFLGLAACGPPPAKEAVAVPAAGDVAAPAAVTEAAAPAPEKVAATASPLPPGYYALTGNCDVAMKVPTDGVVVTATHLEDIDADYPIQPVVDLGGGKFKLGEAIDVLRQTGPKSFVAEEGKEHERRFLWCADKRP